MIQMETDECFQESIQLVSADWFNVFISNGPLTNLLQFLNGCDIVKLDSAICNHSARPIWLKCLQVYSTNQKLTYNIINDDANRWYLSKKIVFKKVVLDIDWFTNIEINQISEFANSLLGSIHINQISEFDFSMTDFERLLQKCNGLVDFKLDKKYGRIITSETLTFLGKCCPLLETVTTKGLRGITFSKFEYLIKSCKNLKQIDFTGFDHKLDEEVPDIELVLKCIGIHCPLLEILKWDNRNIESNSRVETGLKEIAIGCPRLHTLSLESVIIAKISSPFFQLQTLHFINVDITDTILINIGNNCPSLKSIELNIRQEISDVGIEGLLQKCNINLINFQISLPPLTTNNVLLFLGKYCLQLQVLKIKGLTVMEEMIQYFTKCCVGLKSITFHNIKSLVPLDFILKCCGIFCPLLETVIFDEDTLFSDKTLVNDGLRSLAIGCTLLHTLVLKNVKISKEGMMDFHLYCHSLTSIDLTSSKFPDEMFSSLGKIKSLKSLELPCHYVSTEEDFSMLFKENHSIEKLALNGVELFTNRSYYNIGNYCPNLKTFSIGHGFEGFREIEGFIYMFHQCKELIHFDENFDAYSIKKVVELKLAKRRRIVGYNNCIMMN